MSIERSGVPPIPSAAASSATRMRKTGLCMALLAALTTAPIGTACAVDVNYDIGVSLLHSDNIRLSDSNHEDETVLSPRINFDAKQTGSTVRMDFSGSLEYLHYFRNTFGDEARGELSGLLNWTVVPERMDFVFKDYLSRQPVNELISFNPGNQQQVNVFNAGPSVYANFSGTTRGQLDLRYSNSYAEKTRIFNGDRYNAAARLLHELSSTGQVSGNVEATQVRFDSAGAASDYTRYDGYFGHTRELPSGQLDVELGYSRVQLDQKGTSFSSPLIRGNLDWSVSPRSVISIDVRRQFSDVAEDLVAHAGVLTPSTIRHLSDPGMLVGPDLFRQRRIEIGYRFTDERLTLQLRPHYQSITYVDSTASDQSSLGGYFQIDYRLRPLLTLSFLASFENHKFKDLSRNDDDFTANLALTDQITRHWSWRVELQHRNRRSSVVGQRYDENEADFSVIYRR